MGFLDELANLFWPMKKKKVRLLDDVLAEKKKSAPPEGTVPPSMPPPAETPADVTPSPRAEGSAPPSDLSRYRSWRLTYYYVSGQDRFSGATTVPVFDRSGKELCRVEPGFFGEMSLEGTGKLRDGRLLNVAGANVAVRHEDYAAVWERHKKYLSKRPPGYSGLVVKDDRVVAASAYHWVPQDEIGVGYGALRGKPLVPFKSLAADIGKLRRHEPRWKGKGGVCPLFTRVYIGYFKGKTFPDGNGGSFVHDGWFDVVDTGGGIFGKHFDVFVGTYALVKPVKIPGQTSVWYEGIEERVPPNKDYTYGLED